MEFSLLCLYWWIKGSLYVLELTEIYVKINELYDNKISIIHILVDGWWCVRGKLYNEETDSDSQETMKTEGNVGF